MRASEEPCIVTGWIWVYGLVGEGRACAGWPHHYLYQHHAQMVSDARQRNNRTFHIAVGSLLLSYLRLGKEDLRKHTDY